MEWLQFLIVIITIAGFIYMHRTDVKEFRDELKGFREKWMEESKDFHGRLERQDAEFKAFLKKEEEKRTQILMGK